MISGITRKRRETRTISVPPKPRKPVIMDNAERKVVNIEVAG